MNTKFYPLALLLIYTLQIFGQSVSIEEAKLTAHNFFYERINQYEHISYDDIVVEQIVPVQKNETTVYYVIDINPQGWLLISANKNSIPIPAYSLSSNYSHTKQPPQFTAWVKQYADQIENAIIEKLANEEAALEWERLLSNDFSLLKTLSKVNSVEPMLLSNWDQGNYYNQMCPDDPEGPANHCYTGCVATAMGQLCEYFRWPINGTGSYAYEHDTYGTISANFEETIYRWNEMTNEVFSPNLAVAELLFHLGVSVDMVYGPDGSGMYNHKAAYSMRTHFRYAPETEYLYRDSTNLDWDSTVLAHLDKGIPMYYAGWSVPNLYGHAFIVDGYQTEEYFHFNWGWGGSQDGYFYLEELSPGGSNFNLAQELIINCYPDSINYSYPAYYSGPDTLTALNGTITDGSGPLNNYENNANCSWLINPQSVVDSVSFIKLEFNRFNTEENADIVKVYDGPTTSDDLLGIFSGSIIPQMFQSTGNKVLVTFESDNQTQDDGWFLSYSSESPEWCNGIVNYTAPLDTIEDGSGDFYYQNGSTCMWYIQPEAANTITLTFMEFDTEADADLVKIYNASTNTLLETFSGNVLPPPLVVETDKIMIAFTTTSNATLQGWKAWYTVDDVSVNASSLNSDIVRIYPNPANDIFNLEFDQNQKIESSYEIRRLNGQVVSSGIVPARIQKQKFDTKGLKAGVYLITIRNDDFILNKKVIINP